MSEIEKIQQYIEKTAIPEALATRHEMCWKECLALAHSDGAGAAIALAFSYGRAKGYRAAKAEARRGQAN